MMNRNEESDKQKLIKTIIKKALFVIFAIMLANNYLDWKQEYRANEDIFTFEMVDNVDLILDDNNRINLSRDYNHALDLGIETSLTKVEWVPRKSVSISGPDLDPNRCTYFYALIQRWYLKYIYPLFYMLGLMLIVQVVFYYIDFEYWYHKIKEGAKDEDNL